MKVNKMETLNKEITTIDKAKEIIQNFPEKLTKTQEELKELVSEWDYMKEKNKEVEEYNEQLKAEYEKHKPIIEESIEANSKLEGTIEAILNPRIKKAWESERKDEQFRGYGEMWQLERRRWEMVKITEKAENTAQQLADLLTYKWRRNGYYSNDFLKVEKQIETRLNRLIKTNGK